MGKTVGKIALGVGLVALALTGVGAIGASALAFGLGVTGTTLATIGVVTAKLALGAGLAVILKGASSLAAGQGVSAATVSRLNLSLDPNTPRKMVFGQTAMGTDIAYQETSGTNQEYVDYIIVCAAHEVQSIDSIYSDGAVIWTLAGGVQGIYAGYLTVTVRTVGTSANGIAINGGAVWSSACTLTGCAYVHLRIKRTGDTSKVDSPFAAGLPARMTIIGKGMKLYDPARDSTRGGSGAHRADNQATWEYTSGGTELGQNHALQALAALLGWRINGVVSVGEGMDPDRIDMADFITARNICDEAVALLPSGSQRRYEGAGIFADTDTTATVLGVLCLHMNAEMRDVNGTLGIRIAHDDLTGLPSFTIADVLGGYTYDQYPALADTPNIVRGRYVDATTAGLYQLAPYTTQSETSVDGVDRPTSLDLSMCQDPTRAARIARQVLRRGLYAASFTADFDVRALGLNAGDALDLTFSPAGLVAQPFRVVSQQFKVIVSDEDAQALCPLMLQAESSWIYAWDGIVTLPPAAIPTIAYNPQNAPNAVKVGADIGVDNAATRNVNRGAWAGNTVYAVGDFVPYGTPQQTYICGTAHTSSDGSPPPNASFSLFVAAGGAGAPGLDTLNVTASPTAMTVACSPVGAPNSGQLPRTVTIKVRLGGTDITGSCTITNTGSGCTITDSGSSYTVDAIAGDTAKVATAVTYGALAGAVTTQISKTRDGSPAISVQSTFTPTGSASFVSAGELTLAVGVAGSGGTITLDASLDYDVASGFYTAAGKWQYRTTPGSGTYIDVAGAETVGSTADATVGGGGSLFVGDTMTGPTTPTNWEFKFLHRRYSGGTSPFGTGTMQASFAP